VIIEYGELLREGIGNKLSPEQTTIAQRISSNARSLLDLINNVLDLSRLAAGRFPVDCEKTALAQVLSAIEVETQDVRALSRLTFRWEIAADVPPVSTDTGKLKIILKNLVNNAIKFTEVGGVTVRVDRSHDHIRIRVTDTGIGIAPEQQVVIFEAFQQGRGGNVHGLQGVGLGLHIVKQLLDLLERAITVESTVGQGSRFSVSLPFEIILPFERA